MATKESPKGKKPGIRWEFIVAILTVFVTIFVVFSGLWYLSTFDSMRSFTNGVYSKTDDWQGVNEQYDHMVTAFNQGDTSFMYHIAGIDILINKTAGATKDQYLDMVLDGYTTGLYEKTDLTGVKGAIHTVAGKSTHDIYTILTVIGAILVLVLLVYAFMHASGVDFLKQVGAALLISGIVCLIGMYLVYALLVNNWINTDTAIYKEGLPIIAQMIKDWFTVYLAAEVILGAILVIPAALQLLTKGKDTKANKPAAPK